jgi:hypothetical protein
VVKGILRDLLAELGDPYVGYSLVIGGERVPLNPLIGSAVRITFTGEKRCIHCNRKSNKLFNGGSCWPCFQSLARNDLCQVKPSLCHYETCREPAWGDAHCMIPTYVYLAKSSDIKVGITRNIPGRWMDQGAVEAIPIALVPTRKMAGDLELYLTQHLPDKTNWRKMLKGEVTETSLLEVRDRILSLIPDDFRGYILPDETVRTFEYPVAEPLEKITSHDLEKGPVEGRLVGIKGSYLILNTGVLNIPKFAGFTISFEAENQAEVAVGKEGEAGTGIKV